MDWPLLLLVASCTQLAYVLAIEEDQDSCCQLTIYSDQAKRAEANMKTAAKDLQQGISDVLHAVHQFVLNGTLKNALNEVRVAICQKSKGFWRKSRCDNEIQQRQSQCFDELQSSIRQSKNDITILRTQVRYGVQDYGNRVGYRITDRGYRKLLGTSRRPRQNA